MLYRQLQASIYAEEVNSHQENKDKDANIDVKPDIPRMMELSERRLASFNTLLLNCIDYFGSIRVRVIRCIEKRWCMLNLFNHTSYRYRDSNSLLTDSCIMGLRNFISRR